MAFENQPTLWGIFFFQNKIHRKNQQEVGIKLFKRTFIKANFALLVGAWVEAVFEINARCLGDSFFQLLQNYSREDFIRAIMHLKKWD